MHLYAHSGMSHVDHTESTVQLEWSSCAAKLCTLTVETCESILLVNLVVNLPCICCKGVY